MVGCEALFVPYAGDRAGFLFAAGAFGMLAGDVLVGRILSPAARQSCVLPLRLLLPLPYLMFLIRPDLPLAMLLAMVASVGFAAALPLQERLIAHSPAEARGQVLGLQQNGMLAGQQAVAVLAGLSLVATMGLTRGLRRTRPGPAYLPAGSGRVPDQDPSGG